MSTMERLEAHQRTYVIPVSPRATVAISGEFTLTQEQWAQMLAVLDAMKPGLVLREGDRA